LVVNGQPVLMHTLSRFAQAGCELILVLPQAQIDYWKQVCADFQFDLPHLIAVGGDTRFQSVKNGLALVPSNCLVAIHDGVRPCVDRGTIQRTLDGAALRGNAIASVQLKDSIRQLIDDDNHSVDRSQYAIIQTPQTFQADLIRNAYLQSESPIFTDDASVLEQMGKVIHLVEGDYRNIKITTPEDLHFAEILLSTPF
jgi:2-C-methyl-D-erythritol 4-phosphate cytidylyltransferase